MGHHYVPQKYLRGFRDQTIQDDPEIPQFIWMYDKSEGTFKHLPISKVVQVPAFYEQNVEKSLNDNIERPGNAVITNIRNRDPLDDADRRSLTNYIGTMIGRVPSARAVASNAAPAILATIVHQIKEQIKEAAKNGVIDEQTMTKKLAQADAYKLRHDKQLPSEITNIIREPWPFASWLAAIYNMNWRILRSEGPKFFLTSDNPVTLLAGEGLENKTCELTFPICTDILLQCSWVGPTGVETGIASQGLVEEFNRRTAFGAERFLFYHEQASWVLELAANKTVRLNRIRWG